MASSVSIDGQSTEWTLFDRLDFGVTGVSGFKIYGRVVDGTYHFALDSSTVPIGANSTLWLNTDQNTATGYNIGNLGADYRIEFVPASNLPSGARPTLYSLAADGSQTLVEDGVSFAFSADGKFVELAIDKTKIGSTAAVSTLIDVNEQHYLPSDYSQGRFTLEDEVLPVRTDTTLKVAIIFSATSADHYFSETAYSQLIMAAQSQAAAAGIPFDILTENDLTNLATVVNYDALIFPSFGFVQKDKVSAIEEVLTNAAYKYGISLVAAGNFMTNDETGAALPGNSYARMESLLGVKRMGGNNVDEVTVTASGGPSSHVIGYDEGEQVRTYLKNSASQVGTAYFDGVTGGNTQVLATQTASDGTHNAVLATQTGGNNVFFATEGMLADSNMLQHAIGWAARPQDVPELKLQMGRQASLFAARNDMDQSQEARNVSDGIYTKMLSIIEKWKTDFNFVGSYYVNIGNDAGNGQTTDWTKSKPVYDQLLAMGNEIGTHSYTHPEDTNLLTPERIQFEFQQSKAELEQKLGITIKGAAVPGAPESLLTSQRIGQYFEYMTGGYTGVGAGYPGAFGYITPGSDSVYLAPNMKFDFSMVEAAPEFGGGLTPEQAKQEWIREFEELSLKSDMPVFVWPWHDYGPTQWVINEGQPSAYTEEMYTEFLRYAYEKDTEFVTMVDLAQRIKAFEQAKFSYNFNSASNTIAATVTANQIGTFTLDVEKGQTIASVSGWYAYDNDSVFMDADGGTYTIKLGTPEDVTHITALPARAQLLSVTGDGVNLNFSIRGEGKIAVDLTDPQGRELNVTGAEIASRNGDKLELKVSGSGDHNVSVTLKPAALSVTLANDTGSSINDGITSNGNLNVTGVAAGASIEYSADGNTWTNSFTPNEGQNTVYVRQTDTTGAVSEVTIFSFELDRAGPNSTIELPPLDANNTSTVMITFSEVPDDFDPEADLEVVGGSLTNVTVDASGKVYTGTFKAFSNFEGTASVALKANSYTDKAGNAGSASFVTLSIDTKAPTVTSINLSKTLLRAGETSIVTIVFSEKVTGFTTDDVTADNGMLSNLVSSDGGMTWTAVFTPTHDIEDSTNVVRVMSNYADLASNAGTGFASGNYALDTKGPTASIALPPLDRAGESTVTITFSEVPEGFDPEADLDVVGGTLTNLAPDISGMVYTGTFKAFANQDGTVRVGLKAGSYTDSAGNAGQASSATLGVDTRAPTAASINLSKTSLKAGETAAVTIIFSEKVEEFDNADVTAENGTLSTLTTPDGGKTWTGVFTPTQNIEDATNLIKVTGSYVDLAGNAGQDSNSGNYAVDTKGPTVAITQTKLGSSRMILATFTFSEAIDPSTFTAQDVIVTGAKMESLAFQGGTTYTAILNPLMNGNGQVSIGVNSATYADVAGNAGTGGFKAFGATQVKASSGADWLVGTNGNNSLKGGRGDDIIRGGKGNDTISGDGGKDLLDFSDGKKGIKITLSQENTKYTIFDGRSAGLGVDKYRDMEGVIGTEYTDTITGSSSSDILVGLGGNDILRGGRSNDVFVFESNGGRDRIMDFEDTGRRHDKLDVRFFDFDVTSSSFAAWKADHVKQQGSHTIVNFDASTSVTLANIKAKAIGFDDFLF